MVHTITRYKWAALLLPLVLVGVVFHSLIWAFLTSGTQTPQAQIETTPMSITSSPHNPTVVQVCFDTPPLYSSNLAHAAAVAIAEKIDSLVTFGSPGLVFFSSFLTSHSYGNEAVSFSVPAVVALPPSPVPQHSSDPYKDRQYKNAYEKAVSSWQQTVSSMQGQLHTLQAQVHGETNKLRHLNFPYDASGSDVLGCLADASTNFQAVKGVKVLLIASDLVNTTSTKEIGALSLSGVVVRVLYHTCVGSPADCSTRDSYWKSYLLRSGAVSVQFFTVAQSTALQETF